MLNGLKMCMGKKVRLSLHYVKSSVEGTVNTVLYQVFELYKDSKHLAVLIHYVQDQLFLLLLETKF